MLYPESTCLIIDDDQFASETLADYLGTYENINILKILNESRTAIKDIAILKPDIVFLDINMPEKDGLNVLNEINELGLESKVIFITAYHEYLLDALKKNAFDYLIKPIRLNELNETLSRYFGSISGYRPPTSLMGGINGENDKIVLKNSHGSLILNSNEVLYIQADGCYTQIRLTNNRTETISRNLGNIESLFPDTKFYKISRSVIINLTYLNKLNRIKRLVYLLSNEEEISIKASKEKLYNLESFLNK